MLGTETGKFTKSQARQNSLREAESATGRQIQQFVVEDRRQAGITRNQALEECQKKAGQKEVVSVTGRPAGRQLVLDPLHTAENKLAPNESKSGA